MASPVHLEVRGEGPVVLFIHGSPTPWDVLRPVADVCTARRTLLAMLPGYGSAPAWPGAVTAESIAEAIEEALLAVDVRRATVVGFSAGAYHALHLAVRRGVDVESVVAIGGFASLSTDERAGFRGFAQALESSASFAGVPTERFLAPAFAEAHPDACARVEAWINATPRANLAREFLAGAASPSLLERLRGFHGRVLARTGSLDVAVPPSHAEAIAKACPRGQAQIAQGKAHALLEEDLDETTKAVLSMLA